MARVFFFSDCPNASTLDIIFVLDGSGSVGKENFDDVKDWVKKVSEGFNISKEETSIGVIQYSGFNNSG